MHLSRKLLLKLLADPDYLESMNALLSQVNASVSAEDIRLPDPPNEINEQDFSSLAQFIHPFLSNDKNSAWWKNALKNYSPYCWDFVSTCTINGKKGLLLIESKAKKGELITKGNLREPNLNLESNYAIAGTDLQKVAPDAKLSSVTCRQMSNHIYRSWFLARSGIPVILMYLGFHFTGKQNNGNRVFTSGEDWRTYFLKAARKIGVSGLLNKETYCGDSSFTLLSASIASDTKNPPHSEYRKYYRFLNKVKKKIIPDAADRLLKTKNERKLITKTRSKKRIIRNKRFIKSKFNPEKVLDISNESLTAIETNL